MRHLADLWTWFDCNDLSVSYPSADDQDGVDNDCDDVDEDLDLDFLLMQMVMALGTIQSDALQIGSQYHWR